MYKIYSLPGAEQCILVVLFVEFIAKKTRGPFGVMLLTCLCKWWLLPNFSVNISLNAQDFRPI